MRATVLVLVVLTLATMSAFAIDGVVLINQSTVMAAGGFPYKITQAGSYKLSGNLTMSTTPSGNFNGIDVAILVESSNVALDLNGFSIIVNDAQASINHPFYGIAGTGSLTQTSIANGSVRVTSTNIRLVLTAINFQGSYNSRFSELNLLGLQPFPTINQVAAPMGNLLFSGANSLVQHVVTDGSIVLQCPSTAIDDIGFVAGGDSCLVINSSKSLVIPSL